MPVARSGARVAAGALGGRQRLPPRATTAGGVRAQPASVRRVRKRADRGRGQSGPPVPPVHLRDHILARAWSSTSASTRPRSWRIVGIAPGSLVVDIGSNDGSLLNAFQELGYRVVGVDPAIEIADACDAAGSADDPRVLHAVHAPPGFGSEYGPAALVTANNVFAHSDKLPAMADAIRELLAPDGLFVTSRCPISSTSCRRCSSTRSTTSTSATTRSARSRRSSPRHGLQLDRCPAHPHEGRVASRHGATGGWAAAGVARSAPAHRVGRVDSPAEPRDVPRAGGVGSTPRRSSSSQSSTAAAPRAKSIAGYGASPTVTTLLNQFDLGRRLDFLVDDNPVKQHTFSPGHQIPVYPPEAIYERDVDVIAVLAWNYAAPIIAKHRRFAESGRSVRGPPATVAGHLEAVWCVHCDAVTLIFARARVVRSRRAGTGGVE